LLSSTIRSTAAACLRRSSVWYAPRSPHHHHHQPNTQPPAHPHTRHSAQVKGVEYKAKGGARLQVMDASGAMHAVAEKSIHVNLGVHKGKLVEPSAILADFQAVMALEPTALGVDPESLAMAWELAAEEEGDSFSTKFLLSLVDDTFFKAQTDAYRAFRLLSSDLGKVFFKNLGPNTWKAKAAKAVEASKQNWCRELKEDEAEWCLV